MEKGEIKKRLTRKIMSCIMEEKCKIVAIWVTDNDTEIFICPENPDEKTASTSIRYYQKNMIRYLKNSRNVNKIEICS